MLIQAGQSAKQISPAFWFVQWCCALPCWYGSAEHGCEALVTTHGSRVPVVFLEEGISCWVLGVRYGSMYHCAGVRGFACVDALAGFACVDALAGYAGRAKSTCVQGKDVVGGLCGMAAAIVPHVLRSI